jgi:hypothetical protein
MLDLAFRKPRVSCEGQDPEPGLELDLICGEPDLNSFCHYLYLSVTSRGANAVTCIDSTFGAEGMRRDRAIAMASDACLVCTVLSQCCAAIHCAVSSVVPSTPSFLEVHHHFS